MTESLNSIKTNVLNVTRHTTSQSIDRIGAFDNRCPAIFMHNPNDIWTHSSVHTCGRVELIWMKNSMHACLQMKCKHGIRNKKFEASAGVRRTHGSVFRIGKTSKCVVMKISHSFDGWTLDHWTFRVISFYMWIILIWYHINTRSVHVFRPMFKNVQEWFYRWKFVGRAVLVRFKSVCRGDSVSWDDKELQFLRIFLRIVQLERAIRNGKTYSKIIRRCKRTSKFVIKCMSHRSANTKLRFLQHINRLTHSMPFDGVRIM